MEDDESFATVLRGMQALSKKRDPRSVRLAAVTSALLDVVGDQVSPAKVYASTVSALEGTLEQGTTDSLSTQVALLELLRMTIPHVSSATIEATLSLTSRVLRGVVTSSQTATATETKDELGGINATLRGVTRASSEVLKKLFSSSVPEKAVKHLYHGTILVLFEDRRPKVRKAAHNATLDVLMTDNITCHPAISRCIQSYSRSYLKKQSIAAEKHTHLLHLLGFLERAIVYMKTRTVLEQEVLELLVAVLQKEDASSSNTTTTSDFVANASKRDVTGKILLVNGLLSVLIADLEDDDDSSRQEERNAFAARVLANLLQARPMTLFVSLCDDNLKDSGRTHYGRLVLLSCQRVLSTDVKVGCKLFPLTIQMILQLSRPSDEAPSVEVAQALMVELTRTFRLYLSPLVEQQDSNLPELAKCLDDSLQGMQQVLHHTFRPTWSVTLQALAYLLHIMRQDDEKVAPVVENMIQLHKVVAEDQNARDAVEAAIGSLIQGVGIEGFWNWVSWKDPKGNAKKKGSKKKQKVEAVICADRVWLLPLMKTSSMAALPRRPRLGFFQEDILNLARKCDAAAAADPASQSFHRARVVELWALFPCFCQRPIDLEATFPSLAQTLVRALGDSRYPQLVNIICGRLRALASEVDERRKIEEETLHEEDTEDSVEKDAAVLAEASTKILPALFQLVETIHGTAASKKSDGHSMDVDKAKPKEGSVDAQRSQVVIESIAAIGRLAPKPYLQSLFKKVMQRLLLASQSDEVETEKICTLLGLSQALVTSEALDDASVSLLYRAIKPLIRTDEHEARVQKRAYKVLLEICKCYPSSFVTEAGRLQELTSLLLDSIMTSQVSARHMRLRCISLIIEGLDGENAEHAALVAKIVPEVLLCLKDSNAKTREAAYQLLISMTALYDNKTEIFKVVMAALGAQTAHMRSAAVVAASRLVFEYARVDESVYDLLPSLLQTVIVLFDEDSREVTKSVIGFVRVSVAAMSPEQLDSLLPELVGGLLKYHKGKDRFRAKIKIILKKLVRMYGYDRLMPLVPESDARLLTHMRKLSERAARRKAAQQEDGRPDNNQFDDLMESDEEDSDDGRTLMTGATGFTRLTGRTGKSTRSAAVERSVGKRSIAVSAMTSRTRNTEAAPRLRAEASGEVMDMLDPKMAKNVHFADNFSDDSDSDSGVMEFDEMGRLVVHNEEPEDFAGLEVSGADGNEIDEINVPLKRQRLSKFESAKVARDEAQKRKNKKQVQSLGAAYKSKKAGGDVKKKGQKYEPYAYVPLDGKSYSKKNRRGTVERMSTVVRQGGKRKRR